jgi:hypothetical protein
MLEIGIDLHDPLEPVLDCVPESGAERGPNPGVDREAENGGPCRRCGQGGVVTRPVIDHHYR